MHRHQDGVVRVNVRHCNSVKALNQAITQVTTSSGIMPDALCRDLVWFKLVWETLRETTLFSIVDDNLAATIASEGNGSPAAAVAKTKGCPIKQYEMGGTRPPPNPIPLQKKETSRAEGSPKAGKAMGTVPRVGRGIELSPHVSNGRSNIAFC
ncbi:hypothetical protein Syun_023557 [Stephania yunnanensis]|uniref:Uncharacterized protein n=1 Tax=Stephania yunnanensis TaxID=152371 RepID=A0AAP0FA12_9MAGN